MKQKTFQLFNKNSGAPRQAPEPPIIVPHLPPPSPVMDHTICDKYIEYLSNMAYTIDAQAKALNDLNTLTASG